MDDIKNKVSATFNKGEAWKWVLALSASIYILSLAVSQSAKMMDVDVVIRAYAKKIESDILKSPSSDFQIQLDKLKDALIVLQHELANQKAENISLHEKLLKDSHSPTIRKDR